MLDLFVAALITAGPPSAIPQVSATAAAIVSDASKSTAPAQRYERVGTTCQDVQNLNPDSANNDFSPLAGIPAQNGIPIDKLNPKITVLEVPKHGNVRVTGATGYLYTFIPDENYLGKDRVVYEIEVHGKRYKYTINFWVMPVVADPVSGDPFRQQCEYQKFEGSAVDPYGLHCKGKGARLNWFFY